MNQQEFEATNFRELITELAEKNDKLLKDYYAVAQTCDDQKDEIARLKKELANANERLHWIYAVGVDYDGMDTVEGLKDLVDEMIEFTQMTDEQVDYSIYRKGAEETADKIVHYLYRMSQNDTSKEVAMGRCIDWIKNNFGT